MDKIKLLSVVFIILVVLTFTLFFLGFIRPLSFWLTIAIAALFAYKIIPKLRKSL